MVSESEVNERETFTHWYTGINIDTDSLSREVSNKSNSFIQNHFDRSEFFLIYFTIPTSFLKRKLLTNVL
jgi:hypothetical protein